ncbi:secretory subunit [Steccherinum ochraceum]|uniref:Secretory subunit n=1 Tax=Steccherinum ochraceum TaxID=92696 RepID=A0A4R0S0A8_9APHY|nr:secretory subunit [Steccherinum ochraceum]
MANYNYDEAGNMAAYFLLTFLFIVLVPLSIPSSSKSQPSSGCACEQCTQHRSEIRKLESGSFLNPKHHRRAFILAAGWAFFSYVAYKVATIENDQKVYNPFEILGISSGTSLKDIKSHYKKLSKVFHPDKVKLAVNETIEMVEARFVDITKAYKSLTDETIRENWERYGHPDGRQEVSMGIALPKWIVEGKNNIWVLGAYGVIFGVALPSLVGNWWFGNRSKTKDGVNARSAATYFKMLSEDSGMDDVLGTLGKTFEWERPKVTVDQKEFTELEATIGEKLGEKWVTLRKLAEIDQGHERRRVAFALLYAHLLRLPLSPSLRKEQAEILLQTQALLSSLLNITISRNWLTPTLAAMRLHAYLVQALNPGQTSLKYAQLPSISDSESQELVQQFPLLADLLFSLEEKGDDRAREVKKVANKWGKLDLVEASFQVIDDRIVTPSSIVYLVVKVRLTPPTDGPLSFTPDAKSYEKRNYEFLASKKDVEDVSPQTTISSLAHAPHWPSHRKPSWWVVLGDPKTSKVVVPPMKITDIPYADPEHPDVYRSYKLQFQAPPNVMSFPWRVYIVSDTFVGEEVAEEITLRIDDLAALEEGESAQDDDISDPEEDSLAGQMAMMRGGSVKKRPDGEDESDDDESSTDDDQQSDEESSDSDSD